MWEGEEKPRYNTKILVALGVGLLLLLAAGLLFIFPFGFVSQPLLTFSKREPSIVASKTYVNPGKLLALTGDDTGFWRVWQSGSLLTVSRFGVSGETEWVEEYNVEHPLVEINGRRLILGDADSGQIFLIEESQGLVDNPRIAGQLQTVAIAETGQWLVTFRDLEAGPEQMDSKLEVYNTAGLLLFDATLPDTFSFLTKFNQNGTQCFLLVSKIGSQGLENQLLSYSDTGQLAWTTQLPAGPAAGFVAKPFGDRLAIAVGKDLICYSGAGQPLWQHTAQGTIHDLSFQGQSDQLAYSSKKLSVFSFKSQSLITALSGQGVVQWQYELKGSIPQVVGSTNSLCVFVSNNLGVHSVGADGQTRWSHKYAPGEVDSERLVAIPATSGCGTVLIQLNDGRMFVLRAE